MRDLAQRRDPVQGGDLAGLLRAMLHEAQRVTGAAAASFLGTEPGTVVHAELPAAAGDVVTTAWRTALYAVREPVSAPGRASRGRCRGRPSWTISATRRRWWCRRSY